MSDDIKRLLDELQQPVVVRRDAATKITERLNALDPATAFEVMNQVVSERFRPWPDNVIFPKESNMMCPMYDVTIIVTGRDADAGKVGSVKIKAEGILRSDIMKEGYAENIRNAVKMLEQLVEDPEEPKAGGKS